MDTAINKVVTSYAHIVHSRYNPKAIYLYGSQAKGTANMHSDIDIAVVVGPMDADEYVDTFAGLFSIASDFDCNIEPNLLIDDGEYNRYSFLAEIVETGRLVNVETACKGDD